MAEFTALIRKMKRNYSAVVPDVPGCVATGSSVEETVANLRSALAQHLQGLLGDAQPIPEPSILVKVNVDQASVDDA